MSVNIYDGTNLIPIAGKTVPMPYTPAPQSMIGDAWVNNHAYAVGDYCIDGNVLYKCKTAHTSSASYRPPYASYWEPTSVASELAGKGQATQLVLKTGNTTSGTGRSSYPSYAWQTTAAELKKNYRFLDIVLLQYSTAESGTEYGANYYPTDHRIIPTSNILTGTQALGATYTYETFVIWDNPDLRMCYFALSTNGQNHSITVDFIIYGTSNPFNKGYAIYGIK